MERQMDDWQLLTSKPQGIATLYQRHRDFVYRLAWGYLARHHLAEDALQEVFLRLQEGAAQPRFFRAQFRTWLYRVTLNVCRELERHHRFRQEVGFEDLPPAQRAACCGEGDGLWGRSPQCQSDWLDMVRQLAQLPPRQREAVVLRYLEGLSTAEAAAVMGCGQGSVKVHLHRAVAALQQQQRDSFIA